MACMISEFKLEDLSGIKVAYDRDGVVIVRDVLEPHLLIEINQHIDWLIERHPELRPERLGHQFIVDDAFWVRFLSDERLLDVAAPLVGPDIAFFAADYIAKPPLDGLEVGWHQDGRYWSLEPMEVITVWFAATRSTRENGCVQVIPGSHRRGDLTHVSTKGQPDLLSLAADPDLLDESEAVHVELSPGDVSVHHPLMLHASDANTSGEWRRGGSIQYMPPTTRITNESWPCTFLFRGEPVAGINHYQALPKYVAGEHIAFRGCEEWADQQTDA